MHSRNGFKPFLRGITDAAVVITDSNKQFASVSEFRPVGMLTNGNKVSAEFMRGVNSGNNYFCSFREVSLRPLFESPENTRSIHIVS
jgi:hypothetical protein